MRALALRRNKKSKWLEKYRSNKAVILKYDTARKHMDWRKMK